MKRSQQNIEQQDLECLIIILDNWLPLLCQMQAIQDNLHSLPTEIDNLNKFNNQATTELEKIFLTKKISSLLKVIDAEIPRLIRLEEKINNLIFAREVLEALQQKLNNNCDRKYELNFKQIQLIKARDRVSKQTQNKNQHALKSIKNCSKSIAKFWQEHHRSFGVVFGVAAITFYGLFSYYSVRENAEINQLDKLDSQTELLQ